MALDTLELAPAPIPNPDKTLSASPGSGIPPFPSIPPAPRAAAIINNLSKIHNAPSPFRRPRLFQRDRAGRARLSLDLPATPSLSFGLIRAAGDGLGALPGLSRCELTALLPGDAGTRAGEGGKKKPG